MKKRRLSILLSIVMLFSLLPTTALAAGYPDPASVSVDGSKSFSSSQCYYKNTDTAGNFTGTSTEYNAHYDSATGTLTLKDYNGGQIKLGGDIQRDLTIKLIGDNKITVTGDVGIVVNSYECNITITAESGSSGKLTINVTNEASAYDGVTGIGNYLATGGGTSGNVTITGYADVTINATSNTQNSTSFGIYAGEVVIEDHAKAAITVKAPTNTGAPYVYGIYAKDNVTINTAGEITVDASNAGTGNYVYSTGVRAMRNLTLTKVGRMTVKWNDKIGNQGFPLSPNASFDSNAYDNNVDKANCIATYTPKTKEFTPTATFTATSPDSGTLSGLVDGGNYAVTGAAATTFTASGTTYDLTGVSAGTLSIVKKGNGTTTTDSDAQTITVNKATAPTGVTAVDCTAAGNDGKLENVTADMEYQKSDAAAWTACGGTEVSGLTNGTYYVRVKVNGTTLASDSQSVTINAFGTTPAAEPNASFTATGRDAGTLVISGTHTPTMQYSVDGGSAWKNVTSTSMPIIGVTAAKGIQVKDVGDGSTTSESPVKSITVTEGAKPTGLTTTQPSTIGGKGKIETTALHEYSTDGGATFTSCTGALDNLNAGAYHVRVKANGTMLASETETYTITAFTGTPEPQPAAIFTATSPDSGTLSNLVSGGKYAVTGAATTNFTASGTTHALTDVVAGTLSIVKKGNSTTTTDSTAQTISVSKAETPSTVTAVGCTTGSNNDGKLKNVTTTMEYQKSGDAAWTDCGGTEVVNLTNGAYLVRVKATGTTLASDNQSVVVAVYTGGGSSSGGSGGGGGYIPSTTPTAKPSTEPVQAGKATTSDLAADTTSKGNETSTTVRQAAADKIVDAAVKNRSEEIVISTKVKNEAAASGVKAAKLILPTTALQTIAEKTDAKLTLQTDVGQITLDNKTIAAVAAQSGSGTVSMSISKVKDAAKEVRFELQITGADGKQVSDFNGGKATIVVAVPQALSGKKIGCVYIDANAHYHKVSGKLNTDGSYTFTTEHFSSYAIMEAAAIEESIAAQKAAVKELKLKLTSKLVKSKKGKKQISLRWKNTSTMQLDGVQIYRSTKRNSGYRKKVMLTSKSSKYTDTAVKQGKKYYYKARGYVTIDGERVYTAASTKAYRTVK